MKLIFAIINSDDGNEVVRQLSQSGFTSTKLASTGGFLKSGNITLLIGCRDEDVDAVIDVISRYSHSRKQLMPVTSFGGFVSSPIEVAVGGATVFVIEAEKQIKL